MSKEIIFVTGGSGFIGSHLIERLLSEGKTVYVFDNVPLEKARNLENVKDHDNLIYQQGDIRDSQALKAFYPERVDVIFHLASVVGVKNYIADPLALIDISVGGTRTMIDIARNSGTKIIFASTSEVYGKNPNIPWAEDGDRVLGATSVDRWCYSTAKAVCEHMFYGVHRQCGLPFSIVRFFNAYGPRQNPYYVVSQSVYKVLRGESPLCYDDGKQTRCFTYIEDVIEGLLRVSVDPKAVGQVFNLGNSKESTMKEVVDLVINLAGAKVQPTTFDTDREYGDTYEDIPRRVPQVTKAKELLDWQATTDLKTGLQKTIDWARKNQWWLDDAKE